MNRDLKVGRIAAIIGLRIGGVRPDFMLGLAVVAAVIAGPEVGAVAGFSGGLLVDLFVNTPFGLTGLVACVVAYVLGSVTQTFGSGPRWALPFEIAAASAVAEVSWAALGTVLGLPGLLRPHLLIVVAVVATINGALALPVATLLRWSFSGITRRMAGSSLA